MKTLKVSLRSIVLGFTVLGVLAANVFAANYLFTVSDPSGPFVENGIIYSVPSGANYEWVVIGSAQILLGGGGLNVNASGGFSSDVGSTAYADSISYQLHTYGYGGYAQFYLGW